MQTSDILADIHGSVFQRHYLEASLLATNDLGDIADTLGIPVEAVEIFRDQCFPVSDWSRLRKIEFIQKIEDPVERNLKLWATTQGMGYIKYRLGLSTEISPVEGVRMLFSDCLYKAKEAFFNPSTSDAGREALRWASQTMNVAKTLKHWVSDGKEALKDIEMALENIDTETLPVGNLDDLDDDSVLNDNMDPQLLEDMNNLLENKAATPAMHPVMRQQYPEMSPAPSKPKDWDLEGD